MVHSKTQSIFYILALKENISENEYKEITNHAEEISKMLWRTLEKM
jgi:hypothetical protein